MFEEKDKVYILSLKKIINEGDFLLKGRSVLGFVTILKWLEDLEKKIHNDLEPKKKGKK